MDHETGLGSRGDTYRVERLNGPFGAEVHGLDLARDVDQATMQQLVDLLYENKFVVFKNQTLDEARYVRFGHFWGEPIDFFKNDDRGQKHPELIRVSNATSVPMQFRDGAVQWHSDSSYDEVPASVTMLLCMEAPRTGGATLFSDTAAAYDGLPEETRSRLAVASAWHTMLGAPVIEGERTEGMKGPAWGKYLHPLAMPHPFTGRRALFTSATAQSVEGMPYEEGREFIRELRRHMVQPQFRQDYTLRPGDLILWDNYALVHSATPLEYSDEPGKRRLLYRISTKGLPKLSPTVSAARETANA